MAARSSDNDPRRHRVTSMRRACCLIDELALLVPHSSLLVHLEAPDGSGISLACLGAARGWALGVKAVLGPRACPRAWCEPSPWCPNDFSGCRGARVLLLERRRNGAALTQPSLQKSSGSCSLDRQAGSAERTAASGGRYGGDLRVQIAKWRNSSRCRRGAVTSLFSSRPGHTDANQPP